MRQARSPEVACHLVYHATGDAFYSRYPDDITGWIRDVLCVETFFGAMCDGGVDTWFDWDHGRLAHLVPDALRAVGLPEFASGADKALAVHFPPPYPATIHGWKEAIEKIRDAQLEDDFDKLSMTPSRRSSLPSISQTKPTSETSCTVTFSITSRIESGQ